MKPLSMRDRVVTVRTLIIRDYKGNPSDRLEKGTFGTVTGFSLPDDEKRDVIFDDHRCFSIPVMWLKRSP